MYQNDLNCKKCGSQLHAIIPSSYADKGIADLKPENIFYLECIKEDCENKGMVIKKEIFKKL